jgi:hypothetical protein
MPEGERLKGESNYLGASRAVSTFRQGGNPLDNELPIVLRGHVLQSKDRNHNLP